MVVANEPRAPFTFREDEPFVGEGPLLRTRRRQLMTICLLVLIILAAVVALQARHMMWSRNLDPAINARTGLPDGTYVLEPSTAMHEAGACWFRGTLRGMHDRGEVTIAGEGPVQCAGEDYEGLVLFSVDGGTAAITRSGIG